MKGKNKILMISVFAAVVVLASVCTFFYLSKKGGAPEESKPFGFEALKFNGSYVSTDIMIEERNKFFEKWKRNAAVQRMSEEERTDMLLDQIIERLVLEDYIFNKSGKTATESEVEDYIKRFIEPRYKDSGGLSVYMSSRGYTTEEEMKKDIEEYIIKHKCIYAVAKEKGDPLTEAEIDEGYAKHMMQNKSLDIRHIFISTQDRDKEEAKALALEIYEKLSNGEDFEALAKQYSEDEETKDNGGIIKGLISGFHEEAYDNAVFTAEPGELLEPIEVYNGYEIVYVDKVVNYYRTRSEYEQIITVDKFVESEKYKEWLEELKKGYDIEITDLSMKAFRLFREGKYDESGNCYEELYKQKKDIYYMDKATEMYRIAENWEKLLETSKVCSKKNPDNLLYQVYQAEAMLKTGDEEGALKLLEKAEKSAEGNTYFLSMIKEFYKNYGFEEEAQRIEQKQNQ
ncbi:MAG TPA: peptidylprolyl isomerase [Acetivibrio sp.]|nr:peptidylprolyl isomerase [Clostridium sp.]HOQ36878.1 peptidylprolyl isomerase [Acetivibrio sp.]HPT89972.1 peptidylprolyl isomerase [Acetivibrio sp.]HQA58245.1 peptidylprolyl isomerase [Acetivibrio sp.]